MTVLPRMSSGLVVGVWEAPCWTAVLVCPPPRFFCVRLVWGSGWSLVLLVSLAFAPLRRPLFSCLGFVFLGACLLLGVLAGFCLGLLPAGFSFSFWGLLPFGICCFFQFQNQTFDRVHFYRCFSFMWQQLFLEVSIRSFNLATIS